MNTNEVRSTPPGDEQATIAETENVIDTYQITAEWIRFADAKAAVVLTVNGALASVLIPTLKPLISSWEKPGATMGFLGGASIVCFAAWVLFTVWSSVQAFRCIRPFRNRKNAHPAEDLCKRFHAVAITKHYRSDEAERFQNEFQQLGVEGFQKEVLAGLLIDAHISSAKYTRVTKAIGLLGFAVIPGFAYLVLSQF